MTPERTAGEPARSSARHRNAHERRLTPTLVRLDRLRFARSIERHGEIVPIEVKAEENLRSKSLRSYINRFQPTEAWRFSLSNYRKQEDMPNIPLYAIGPWLQPV